MAGVHHHCLHAFNASPVSTGITTCGILVLLVSWSPTLNVPEHTHLRAGLFLGLGMFGVFPIMHALLAIGYETLWSVFWPIIGIIVLYVGGGKRANSPQRTVAWL